MGTPADMRSRLLVLAAVGALLMGAACNRGDNDDDATPLPTDAPETTPGIESVADFQVVGTIDEAFAGQVPPVTIPSEFTTEPSTTPGASPATSPASTPVGEQPTRGGIIRLVIDDLSDDLGDACGLEQDDVVHVWWTTDTYFQPGGVLDDVEDQIEDRTAAMLGTIYQVDGGLLADEPDPATPTPAGSPEGTVTPGTTDGNADEDGADVELEAGSDCLLVATQIGFGQTTLPTPRPRSTPARTSTAPARTSTPSPTATRTPTATVDPTDSPEPDETDEPTETDEPSASP